MALNSRFNMSYSQNNLYLTDNLIREIKEALISRDRDQILYIIDKMKELMTNEEVVLWFIKADIPEDLCDAINFLDIMTTRCIYACLEEMMKFQEFFAHNHASYAIDWLIKGLYMLIKNNSNDIIVKEALSLLIVILHGYGKHGIIHTKANIENTIQLLPEIFKDEITAEMKIQIGFLIEKILNSKIFKLNNASREILFNVIIKWFSCFKQIAMNLSADEFVILNSSLSEKILRFFKNSKEWLLEDDLCNESNKKAEINSSIYKFLIEVGAPYFEDVLVNSSVDSRILENFFQALIYAFEEMPEERSKIAQKIGCMGYFFHLTNVLSSEEITEEMNLQKLSLDLLTKILLSLSEDVFEFPEMWPAGLENFKREFVNGISLLPLDASTWLDFLADANTHRSSKLALIVYLYFYFLCAKNFDTLKIICPAVVNFINFSTEIISEPLFVKAVWFVFAMSQLSISPGVPQEEMDLATDLIIKLLEAQKSIEFMYTHHPAVLFWTVSSKKITSKLQHKILECWIQNTNPDCEILNGFAKKSPNARLALISILENGEGSIVESAFFILKSLITNIESDDVTRQIWYMIPSILSKYLTDPVKVLNADFMIELASLKTPGDADLAKAARTAGCLSEIMTKSDLVSLVPCMRLAFQLLDCSEKREDHRVAQIYLRSPGFLEKILNGVTLKSPDVAISSLKIITILWKSAQETEGTATLRDKTKVRVNLKNFLQILSKGDCTIVPSVLELFEEVLKSDFRSDIFIVKVPYSTNLKKLYYHLQNVIVKEPPDTKILSWKCLQLCLTLKSPRAAKTIKNLIFDPWTHEAIRFCINKPYYSSEMKSFLWTWIELNAPFQDFHFPDRHIGGTYFSETVKLISKAFVDNALPPDKLLCKKLLQSNVNLSSEIREELDKMTRD